MNKWLFLLFLGLFTISNVGFSQDKDFYDTSYIPEIRLNFPNKNWAQQLDSLRLVGNGLLFGTAKVDGKTYKNIGVRYRGSKSFTTGGKRNSLHIKLNYINKKQNHQGHKTIKLSNALRDPSLIREVLGYEIARKYMPAPKANYTKVYINDKYYGLYVNVEDVSEFFLNEHFGSNENTFLKCSPDTRQKPSPGCKKNIFASLEYEEGAHCYLPNYELKSDDGWDDLIELSNIITNKPKQIEKVLNVDRTLWMHAFNNVLVNLSSYSGNKSQNYYLYKDDKGQFNPIIWDLNLAFGSYKNVGGGSDLGLRELQELDPLLHKNSPTKPLISQLLKNPEYEKIYLAHIYQIIYDNFVDGEYVERAEELQRLISNDLFSDKNKFYEHDEFLKSLTTTIGRRSKIPGIVELMSKRARFLKKHPKLAIVPPNVTNVTFQRRKELSSTQIETFQAKVTVDQRPKRVKMYYRFAKNQGYKSIFLSDDGKNGDSKANDNTFEGTIDPKGMYEKMEYYIVAENPAAMTFNPPNYMFEPHTVTLEELNR